MLPGDEVQIALTRERIRRSHVEHFPQLNVDLLERTMKQIHAFPETWIQDTWSISEGARIATGNGEPGCGTAYCVAGHAIVLAGYVVDTHSGFVGTDEGAMHISDLAREELGLTGVEATQLFAGDNDLQFIDGMVEMLLTEHALGNR